MADPIGYEVSYDFEGFQAVNPTRPLPADALDNELAGVETAFDDLIACLQTLRRSDGGLQNAVVTYDSLDDQLKAMVGGTDRTTVADLDPSAFALQPDAEAGVASDKLMTPLRTAQAIDAQRAYAIQAEAEAGTEAAKVMSPLLVKQAIDVLRALASEAEAEAGSDNTKVMTPLRTAQAIAALRPALTATDAMTWAEIADSAGFEQTVTVTGAAVGDAVLVGPPAAGFGDDLSMVAWVSAADTVTIRLSNSSGGAVTPTAGDYVVTVLQF